MENAEYKFTFIVFLTITYMNLGNCHEVKCGLQQFRTLCMFFSDSLEMIRKNHHLPVFRYTNLSDTL